MTQDSRTGVLFVCYANMCRSPLAEGLFRHLARERGVVDQLNIDSAGTVAIEGGQPHPLSVDACKRRGIELAGVGRQLTRVDLARFDHIVLMDRYNRSQLERMAAPSAFGPLDAHRARIRLLREISDPSAAGEDLDVPDPIGFGSDGYEHVFELVERGCNALLDEIVAHRKAPGG
jgi:protein-tyrosine phosphatase